ncbi:periplasmic/7TM domain sensor diguanylate cyclase [Cyclobacterium qasimii M12-11B]|uniref:Periplasmic/7TM domain sensor diguanylate cyclase n=1 Tax=Cyclobacterium qasimii M12-11B TaxID=641524 RepID=S7VDS4_9BACT|nr:periplasmic/7TM domain sensor diguanylate cyclase [Cyclobacterium qasimii M12-11B]
MKIYFLLLIAFFYSVNAFSYGLKIFEVQDQQKFNSISLYEYAEITNVGDSNYSFEEFLANENKLKFEPIKGPSTNLGFTESKYWLRFSIKNTSEVLLHYFLETGRPVTDHVDLYLMSAEGTVKHLKNGDLIPFDEKSFPHRKIIFPLDLHPGETYQVFIHYQSDGEVINLPLELHTPNSLIISSNQNQFLHGIFYGVLLLAGAIYLFFILGLAKKVSFYTVSMWFLWPCFTCHWMGISFNTSIQHRAGSTKMQFCLLPVFQE